MIDTHTNTIVAYSNPKQDNCAIAALLRHASFKYIVGTVTNMGVVKLTPPKLEYRAIENLLGPTISKDTTNQFTARSHSSVLILMTALRRRIIFQRDAFFRHVKERHRHLPKMTPATFHKTTTK